MTLTPDSPAATPTDRPVPETVNRYLEGVMAPVETEVTAFDLQVTGSIPAELDGRWLRNGPNPMGDVADPSRHHWFLGDGMVHGVRLRDGRAEWYRNRWVRSDRTATGLGEPLPGGPSNGDRTGFGPNTNVGGFAGQLWAMVEGGTTPTLLDGDLNTIERSDFGGTLPNGFTAHPKFDPSTGELHAMCYCWPDLVDHLQYVVVDPSGTVSRTVDIPVADMPMVHDISITEHWVVVYDLPVTLRLDMLQDGYPLPMGWNPDHPARVGLLRRDAEDASGIIWCDVAPCFVFHPLNAFEDADGRVVIDLCRYEKLFDRDLLGPFGGDPLPTLDRWTIDPTTASVREERIDGRAHEFPRHDPRVGLREHRWAYTATVMPDDPAMHGPIYKTDTTTGAVVEHHFGAHRGGAEPIFVPRAGGAVEDDGWIMTVVTDATTATSELHVIDATDFGADAVAVIHLPQRVPLGFHGNWVRDRG